MPGPLRTLYGCHLRPDAEREGRKKALGLENHFAQGQIRGTATAFSSATQSELPVVSAGERQNYTRQEFLPPCDNRPLQCSKRFYDKLHRFWRIIVPEHSQIQKPLV